LPAHAIHYPAALHRQEPAYRFAIIREYAKAFCLAQIFRYVRIVDSGFAQLGGLAVAAGYLCRPVSGGIS